MGISDTLMWRYWELLTDVSLSEIAAMKSREPMQVKMELAARIVTDFHSIEAARQAADDFNREVRQGAVPADLETVELPADVRSNDGLRIPKLLMGVGLADSRTDAERKLKAGAVEVNGEIWRELVYPNGSGDLTLRVGKKWKKVKL
jgi:tyrosyl-tRNA synthetase